MRKEKTKLRKERRESFQNMQMQDSYLQTPKSLIKEFGGDIANLLSEFIWCWIELADKKGWFYREQKRIKKGLGISFFHQNKGIKILVDYNFLEVEKRGLPAKNWYRINMENINEFIKDQQQDNQTNSLNTKVLSPLKIKELDLRNSEHIYNNIKNNKELLSKESNKCFSKKNSQKTSFTSSNKKVLLKRKKSSYPMTLNPFIPKAVKEIISYWNNHDLQKHKDPTTKLYRKVIMSINRLTKGTFFKSLPINGDYSHYKTKKWTHDEILQAILNFSLAATNCDYLPKSEKSKEWLRKQSLPNFLWNEYAADKDERSLLLKYFENKPELSKQSMRPLTDNYPKMTSAIKRVYNEKTTNNLSSQNIPTNINNCFIKAAKREAEFIKKLMKQRLIDMIYIRTNRSRAELFINASLSNLKSPKDLKPHYLCSDYMFDDIYPRYLKDQAVLEGTIH